MNVRAARSAWDALVMDTQEPELLILKGAEPMLSQFKYIKTEAADFESYVGGTTETHGLTRPEEFQVSSSRSICLTPIRRRLF